MKKTLAIMMSMALMACSSDDPFADWQDYNNQQNNQNSSSDTSKSDDAEDPGTISTTTAFSTSDFDRTINIVYSTSGNATVVGDELGIVSVSGNDVTVNNTSDEKVIYTLSGTSTDGYFKIYSEKKQAIVLNGLNLTNPGGAAINNQGKKTTYVQVNSTSTIADGATDNSGNYTDETDAEDMKAAIFSEGQLVFCGDGTLTVNATGKAGITSDDYVEFQESQVVNVTSSAGHGVRGKEYITVSNGFLTVNVSGNGKKGLSSDSLVCINGGETNVKVTGSAALIDGDYTGTAGIKADQIFRMDGGVLNITNSGQGGKGISTDGPAYFSGGTASISATGANYTYSRSEDIDSKGVKADGSVFVSGGDITITSSRSEGLESKSTMSITGGTLTVTASDDAINSSADMTISGGNVYALSTGNDGLDANGNLYIKGGVVYAIGSGGAEVGIDANTEGGKQLYITGGTVVSLGGIERGSSVSQGYVSGSWTRNTTYALTSGSTVLAAFKTPASGGTGLFISAPGISSGSSYSLISGATVNGTSLFGGYYWTDATASGGSSTSLTATSGSYNSNNNMGGGGNPGGWGGRW